MAAIVRSSWEHVNDPVLDTPMRFPYSTGREKRRVVYRVDSPLFLRPRGVFIDFAETGV